MIDMEPKDAIKLDTVPLDKTYAEGIVLPVNLVKSMEIKETGNRFYVE